VAADQEPTGPFVNAAFLCEQILTDESGVISVIRIVDQVTQTVVGVDVPSEMPPLTTSIKGVVLLKDGQARGRHWITIRMEEPSGLQRELTKRAVHFQGPPNHGNLLKIDLNLGLSSEGLYWFDILLEGGQLLTRIPLEVVYTPTPTAGPSHPAE
jgi:uncharacterized protein DUF6941